MRVNPFAQFPGPPDKYDPAYLKSLVERISNAYADLARAANGELGFGDGTDVDNLMGLWMTYTTNAVANTEDVLSHNLGVIPTGFLLMKPPSLGFIAPGPTTWTTSKLYLQCNAPSQSAVIFVVVPSQGITV